MRLVPLVLAAVLGAVTAAYAGANVPSTSNPDRKLDKRYIRVKAADCHRDVRTHRIGGVMVPHRHVGDDCQVRQVRKVN